MCDDFSDPYDFLTDLGLLDGVRISPRFGVFPGLDGWRIGDTNLMGDFKSLLGTAPDVDQAYQIVKMLQKAEALERI